MANFAYNVFCFEAMKATVDFDLPDDFRVLLVMNLTTADTEKDKLTIGGFTTLDLCDGAAYADQSLASDAVTQDNPNNRAEYDAADITFSTLGAGTSDNVGAVVFKFITSQALSLPLVFIDTGGFPFNGNGQDVTVTWNVQGIIQFQGT